MDRRSRKSTPWRRLAARFFHLLGMAHRHVANLHGDREEYRLAVADFDRAVRLDASFAQALYDRALLLWRELAEGARAEQDLTRVIELEPERAESWFNRAFARQLTGDMKGAIADFERYLAEGDDPMWRRISQQQIENLQGLGIPDGETTE